MKYKLLSITRVCDDYYDIDIKEVSWFTKPDRFTNIRCDCGSVIGNIVSNNALLWNLMEITKAHHLECGEMVDFRSMKAPLPVLYTTFPWLRARAIKHD